MKNKKAIFALSLVLVAMLAVGGTLAYLATKSGPVVNTFTYGDINIDLVETDNGIDGDGDSDTNTYKMVPGNTISKDPTVIFKKGSEASWLFVKVVEDKNVISEGKKFLEYDIADEWIPLAVEPGVYYMEVGAASDDIPLNVIKGNSVKVNEEVTKTELTALGTGYPTLTFTAYAVQKDNVKTVEEAWNIAKGL